MEILVAKTYQGLEVIEAPYEKNKKMYCKVRTKKGESKEVRVYSQKEYDKMYPDAGPKWKPQRELLGFGEDGFILIFNNKPEFETFYEKGIFRYHKIFGWYLPSNEIVPALLPGIVPKVLSWETVGGENGELIAEDKLIKAFNKFVRSI
jgi:hypothetical protein